MKPFLILQLRELDEAANGEFRAFLDYGGLQQADVQRIRMESESLSTINPLDYSGIIIGGGPSNVSDAEDIKPEFQRRFESELAMLYEVVFAHDIPFLGSCYGLGSIIKYAGGTVSKENYSEEVGATQIKLNENGIQDPLLTGLDDSFIALCGHKEACQVLPAEATLLASSDACPVQLIRFKKNIYATQFHCELDVKGIIDRIQYYKHHGYFNPESADDLIAKIKDLNVVVPPLILRRFVDRYK